MGTDRLAALQAMLERKPDDTRLQFGVAVELLRQGKLEEGARALRAYLEAADDEGNAWGRLGQALQELGRDEEARAAYEKGVEAALRHDHPTMAEEFREILGELT
jgi:Flp pilus assembly protein TadD